jgi:hypothetical protein
VTTEESSPRYGAARALPMDPTEALTRLADRYGVHEAQDAAEEVVHDAAAKDPEGEALVLDGLAVLQLARERLDYIEGRLLRLGRDELDLTWIQLAAGLGITSPQGVEQRYKRRVDLARGRDLGKSRAQIRRRRAAAAWLEEHPDIHILLGHFAAGLQAAYDADPDRYGLLPGLNSKLAAGDLHVALVYAAQLAKQVAVAPAQPGIGDTARELAPTVVELEAEMQRAGR